MPRAPTSGRHASRATDPAFGGARHLPVAAADGIDRYRLSSLAEETQMHLPVALHLRKRGRGQTPRRDAGAVESPQPRQSRRVGFIEVGCDFGGLKREVPLDGTYAGSLEIDPDDGLASYEPVRVMRLSVEAPVAFGQLGCLVEDVSQEGPIGGSDATRLSVVIEGVTGVVQGQAE